MKQAIQIGTALLATSLMISISTAVLAEEMVPLDSANDTTTTVEPAQINREAMIEELVVQWGSDDITVYQLRATLEQVNDSALLAVWQADSPDEINTILRGGTDLDGSLALGDTDEDYTFTPVTPCRIVDTRNAGGIMSAGSTREFFVYGNASFMTPQGGNAAGCTSPLGEPRGVMINVTAVPSGNGNLRAYAANVSTPNASLVNYKSGVPVANAAAVKTYYNVICPGGVCPKELEIYSSANSHVIIDVMGYYAPPEATAVQTTVQTVSGTVPSNGGLELTASCPAGYQVTGGGCHFNFYNTNALIINGSRPFGNGWNCAVTNKLGTSTGINVHAVCTRTPGR